MKPEWKTDQTEKLHRMQLVISPEQAANNLSQVKIDNEAGSFGEVVRRAVFLLESVVLAVGFPIIKGSSEPLSSRVALFISTPSLRRIDGMWGPDKMLKSRSEVIRCALELYTEVSSAQRSRKEHIVKGQNGYAKTNLLLMP